MSAARWPLRIAALALLLAASDASAQRVSLDLSPAPHYLGDPIEIRVTTKGFEEDPMPEVFAPELERGQLIPTGVKPSVNTSVTIVNGQIRRSKEVSFVYSYRLQIDTPGPVSIGPFRIEQGGIAHSTRSFQLELQEAATNDRLAVELQLPSTPIYVGERVPVTLNFHLLGELRENLHGYSLRVPFFDLSNSFQFLDDPEASGGTDVKIETASGTLTLQGVARETRRGGEKALTVSIQRTAVPLRAGSIEILAATLYVDEGVRFTRDFFGGRRATRIRKWRAHDQVRRLNVKRIPTERMPPSFAGAVGAGFSLAVTADRTVVQVGDPISLTIELRGAGNLETAALPSLDAEGLLPATQFRVPSGQLAGQLEEGAKRFTAVVRVLDSGVREIPALEYAWFDPETEQFQTTQSRPIALSVRDAEIIGARDVLSEEIPAAKPEPGGVAPAAAGRRPSGPLVLTGADLAIERDPELLLRRTRGGVGQLGWIAGLYTGSGLLVALAVLGRRRRNIDPAVVARRRRVEAELRRVRAAADLPATEAAAELARALRQLCAELPNAHAPEVDAFLGECDAQSYAPAAAHDASPLDGAFHQRALRLAEQMVERAP